MSRNYQLIVAPRKFDFLKTTNICVISKTLPKKYGSFKKMKIPRALTPVIRVWQAIACAKPKCS